MDDWRTDSGHHPDRAVHALIEGGAALAALHFLQKEESMRSILLWMIGVPIPVIILIWLFMH
ncbi:hypothetical protein ACIP02_08815 [Pseudomonas sp. NPDC089408]|uniref:hypothetical protein n=1 Tax=Pseudomonas sp. NPDC089408 TaxID=3364465 RepID=UPI0038103885